MKPLPSKFPEKQHLQISDLSDNTGINKSVIARAAMQIGLKALRESGKRNEDILMSDAKARL